MADARPSRRRARWHDPDRPAAGLRRGPDGPPHLRGLRAGLAGPLAATPTRTASTRCPSTSSPRRSGPGVDNTRGHLRRRRSASRAAQGGARAGHRAVRLRLRLDAADGARHARRAGLWIHPLFVGKASPTTCCSARGRRRSSSSPTRPALRAAWSSSPTRSPDGLRTTRFKRIAVPAGFTVPPRPAHEDVVATRSPARTSRTTCAASTRASTSSGRRAAAAGPRAGHRGLQLRRPRLARARVPRGIVLHLRSRGGRPLPRLRLPLPDGGRTPLTRTCRLRRRRQLVGDPRRLRRAATTPRSSPPGALARREFPFWRPLLLQRPDPAGGLTSSTVVAGSVPSQACHKVPVERQRANTAEAAQVLPAALPITQRTSRREAAFLVSRPDVHRRSTPPPRSRRRASRPSSLRPASRSRRRPP